MDGVEAGIERRIALYLRAAASRVRVVERVGPFLATYSPYSPHPSLNYAIPDDDAVPSLAVAAALAAAFERRGRIPRLVYPVKSAPAVEEVLRRLGFVVEERLPLLACTPDMLRVVPVPVGIDLVAVADDARILALAEVQHEAFGDPPPTPADVYDRRATLAAGATACLARESATGLAVAGGICDVPAHGVTELAGLGVRPASRRQGVGAALAARLTADAFAAGLELVFLTTEHDTGRRLYERAGFAMIGEMVSLSLPPSAPVLTLGT